MYQFRGRVEHTAVGVVLYFVRYISLVFTPLLVFFFGSSYINYHLVGFTPERKLVKTGRWTQVPVFSDVSSTIHC